ncbi:MAG: DUF4410 domain-containing protein [Phycisphaeraceae bacterium]|nr:DUF4410 domain-containing protein [Phycisphaeraceae bacterium]
MSASIVVRVLVSILFSWLPIWMAACSGGSSSPSAYAGREPSEVRKPVYITDFMVAPGAAPANTNVLGREPVAERLGIVPHEDQETRSRKLVELFSKTLAEDLSNAGMRAVVVGAGPIPPEDGWVVRGEFVRLDEGNRLARTAIGLGAGAAEVRVIATVADSAHDSRNAGQHYDLEKKAGLLPGAVFLMNPYAAAAKFVISKAAPDVDVKRAAQALSDQIVQGIRDGSLERQLAEASR